MDSLSLWEPQLPLLSQQASHSWKHVPDPLQRIHVHRCTDMFSKGKESEYLVETRLNFVIWSDLDSEGSEQKKRQIEY